MPVGLRTAVLIVGRPPATGAYLHASINARRARGPGVAAVGYRLFGSSVAGARARTSGPTASPGNALVEVPHANRRVPHYDHALHPGLLRTRPQARGRGADWVSPRELDEIAVAFEPPRRRCALAPGRFP